MKKIVTVLIFVLILVLILSGCAPEIRRISKFENLSIVDFTKYSNENFLITTEPYNGNYQSIGILNYVVRCEVVKLKIEQNNFVKELWVTHPIDTQALIDTLYNKSIDLGGDAIMNFRMIPNSEKYLINSEFIETPGIEFIGFIIKRKK